MRILFMADVPPDPNAGASGTEVRTIAELRRLGHEVDAVWAEDLGRRIAHGNLHYLLELPPLYARAMLAAMERARYDVVHANQPHGWLAAKTLKRKGSDAVFVHRSHGFEPNVEATLAPWREPRPLLRSMASSLMSTLLERHNREIVRWADGHIVSTSLDGDFLAEMGVDRRRIAVVPQAADDLFYATPAPAMTQERLGCVLYVGQFAFVKAPHVVAEAMARIARADPAVELTWVTAAAHHDAVRALLPDDVRGRVALRDWMSTEALVSVYDAHGVLLFPSFYEGFGKVVLEAMSRGLCVVATDTGGAHDVIAQGRSGALVPPGDAEAVADAARALIEDEPRARAMSLAAANDAREYSWVRVARDVSGFYESLRGLQ
jgi:glycosyltransferase involved in cell wall biosynthesis